MAKKIEPFKIRVSSEQAKVVRERMSACGVNDNVPDDYPFDTKYSCVHYFDRSLHAFYDIQGIACPEISFEDFLNTFPETRDGRKIIGYKLKPKFENLRYRIAGLLNNTVLKNKNVRADFGVGSIMHNRTKELQVLNIWFDPVYEEEKPETRIFTIAGNTWLCEKGTRIAKSENGTIIADINDINNALDDAESNIKNESIKANKYKELISFMENK